MLKNIGHRLFCGHAAENSLAGAIFSREKRAWAVETDIQLTKDGVPILMHDKLLERTTNATGYVKDWTASELRADCVLVNDEPVPTLEEVLKVFVRSKTILYLEIVEPASLVVTQELLSKYSMTEMAVISSFHHQVIKRATEKNVRQKVMALFECSPLDPVSFVRATGATQAGLGFDSSTKEVVKDLSADGVECFAWSVNGAREQDRAKKMGFSGVFSDYHNERRSDHKQGD